MNIYNNSYLVDLEVFVVKYIDVKVCIVLVYVLIMLIF